MANDKENPKPQTIEEEAGLPDNWLPVNSAPVIPGRQSGGPMGAPPSFPVIDNFQSGQLPPFLGLSPDLVNAGTPGPRVPTTRLMPIMPSGVSQNVSATVSVVKPIIPPPTPPAPPAPPPVTDGLIHGASPWESDPSYVVLRDDFPNISINASNTLVKTGIGELGWFLAGTPGSSGGQYGGVPPYLGQYMWSNSGTVSTAGYLMLGTSASVVGSSRIQGAWALAENPGWAMSWVFRMGDDTSATTTPFATTKKSIYIGLCGPTLVPQQASISARPDVFIGLRFDTSTTSPSINDSFYTLEVVANHSFGTAARHNTQGTTLVTSLAPAIDGWHRLDIICTVAGKVTITLDGSSTNTLTATIPTMSFTSVGSGAHTLGQVGEVDWIGGASADPPQSPWATGSLVTMSGFTGTTFWNGTWTIAVSSTTHLDFDFPTSQGTNTYGGAGTQTFSGYPAFAPICIFGNDDTATPTANSAYMVVDFFSFIWNPGVISATSATPDSTKARYF